MREFGGSGFNSAGRQSSPAPAAGCKPPLAGSRDGGGVAGEGRLLASWRYASTTASTDSDSFSDTLAAAAAADNTADNWLADSRYFTGSEAGLGEGSPPLLGSRDAPLPSHPASTNDPAGGSAGHTELPDPTDRQLWSPSKRPQAQPPLVHTPQHPPAVAAPAAAPAVPPPLAPPAALQTCVPPGMDAASYAAGERAAFMRAFQQALPGQQALGQLFSAVDALHSRLEEEAAQWRSMQIGATKTSGMVESALQRLDNVEYMRLPQLQEKWEELAARSPEQLVEVLGNVQEVLSLLAQQRELLLAQRLQQQQQAGGSDYCSAYGISGGGGRPSAFALRQLHWLLLAAAGYGQSVLSKADVAALFLSRKILLTSDMVDGQGRASRQLSTALSAALFVASVEAAWHAQQRVLRSLPGFAQRMAAPAQLGLRVARVAVWTAAVVLAAAQTRSTCQTASASICSALEAAAGAAKLPSWLHPLLPFWQRWRRLQWHWGPLQKEGVQCPAASSTCRGCTPQGKGEVRARPEEHEACPASIPQLSLAEPGVTAEALTCSAAAVDSGSTGGH